MAKQIKLRPDHRCPCGSGKLVRDCCALPSGHLRKQVPSLTPPPPFTGHAQLGCYLATTRNCSPNLSAEHYISRSVLEVIGDVVAVDGAPWLPQGERRQIGIIALLTPSKSFFNSIDPIRTSALWLCRSFKRSSGQPALNVKLLFPRRSYRQECRQKVVCSSNAHRCQVTCRERSRLSAPLRRHEARQRMWLQP
jgi:hypothetical protein